MEDIKLFYTLTDDTNGFAILGSVSTNAELLKKKYRDPLILYTEEDEISLNHLDVRYYDNYTEDCFPTASKIWYGKAAMQEFKVDDKVFYDKIAAINYARKEHRDNLPHKHIKTLVRKYEDGEIKQEKWVTNYRGPAKYNKEM